MNRSFQPRSLLRHPVVFVGAVILAFVLGSWFTRSESPRGNDTADAVVASDEAPTFYTCSMHPSVRLTDPDAKCPICFMDLIPVQETGGGPEAQRQLVLDAGRVASARIETSLVQRFFPESSVRLYGKLTYDETRVARIAAYFPGRIEKLFVNYMGVPIARGEHVAEMYSPELLTAFAELREAARSASNAEAMSPVVRRSSLDVLESARQKLRLLGVGKDVVAAVERGDFDGERFTVTSPISGVVTALSVREGDYVNTGDPVATVADLTRLWLDLEAYESQLATLEWGQRATFTVESHPGEVFEGRIAFIEPMVDERTRTAAVRIAVDNAQRHLKPGMFASATVHMRVNATGAILSDELAGRWVAPMHPTIVKDGPGTCEICGMALVRAETLGVVGAPSTDPPPLVIPRSAVLFTGERSVVYVEVPGTEMPTYELREVRIGPRAGAFVTVREGLEEGEAVVTHGAFRIDSDMQIAAKPSMMMPGRDVAEADDAVPADFAQSLAGVYAAYLQLQEGLAADDLAAAQAAVQALHHALGNVRDETLVGPALADWRRIEPGLHLGGEPASLDALRVPFEDLSRGILALAHRFGHDRSAPLFLVHCPMAFDNRGADWLQDGRTVVNPYFGASMLRCGEVREELAPRAADAADSEPALRAPAGHDHE